MTNIVERNAEGYYMIDGEKRLSVTTLLKKMFGCNDGLIANYHIRRIIFGLNKNRRLLAEIRAFKYVLEDDVLPVVKEIVKKCCFFYQADRQGKADYGIDFHKAANNYFFFNALTCEYATKLKQIEHEYKERDIRPVFGEIILHDKNVAGTCDFIGISNKFKEPQLWIVDYKSGSEDKAKEIMQIGKYGEMFVKEHPEYKDYELHGMIIHTGREEQENIKVREYSPTQMKEGVKAFNRLYMVYQFMQTLKWKKGD